MPTPVASDQSSNPPSPGMDDRSSWPTSSASADPAIRPNVASAIPCRITSWRIERREAPIAIRRLNSRARCPTR